MVFTARPTEKVNDFLRRFKLSHDVSSSISGSVISTALAVVPCSEAQAIRGASAACYGCSENVDRLPIVVPKHKFVQVQRQITTADVVIRADHAALQQRPEVFNRVGMDCAANVFAVVVGDRPVWIALVPKVPLSPRVIGSNQRYLLTD